ncbi:MAG: transglycosylase SLT domain-containing protein [Sphingobacteriia bacterium]|nr:transglycosylase SLT domain-containing protein [Sphingobacteriia bacterium]
MLKGRYKVLAFALTCYTSIIIPNLAYASEDIIARDSGRCLRYFSYYEKMHSIPSHLLKAVSLKESGIYHGGSKKIYPWPWAINYKGKGYYFKTKHDAINAVKKIFARGDKSVDVGCMQINLHYHKNAFKSLEHAFDPRSNVEYGAKFLSSNFSRHNSWKHAVAAYHSEERSKGLPYSNSVLNLWRKEATQLSNTFTSTQEERTQGTKPYIRVSSSTNNINKRLNPNERDFKKGKLYVKVNNDSSIPSNRKEVAKISHDTLKQFRIKPNGTYELQ